MTITYIATKKQLKAQWRFPTGDVVGVHFQFVGDVAVAVAISDVQPTPNVKVLRLTSLKKKRVLKCLRKLWSDLKITKVLHNVSQVVRWLGVVELRKINLVKCVDLQLLPLNDASNAALSQLISCYCGPTTSAIAQQVEEFIARVQLASLSTETLKMFKKKAQLHVQCFLAACHLHDESGLFASTSKLWNKEVERLDSPRESTTGVTVAENAVESQVKTLTNFEGASGLEPPQLPDNRPAESKKAILKMPREYITTTDELKEFLASNDNKIVVSTSKTIGVHFQFVKEDGKNNSTDRLLTVTTGDASRDGSALVLLIDALDSALVSASIKDLLEDTEIVKVTYDLARAARCLYHYGLTNVILEKCVDLQLLYHLTADSGIPNATMVQITSQFSGEFACSIANMVDIYNKEAKPWMKTSSLTPSQAKRFVMIEQLYVRTVHDVFRNKNLRDALKKKEIRDAQLALAFSAGRDLWNSTLADISSQPPLVSEEFHTKTTTAQTPMSPGQSPRVIAPTSGPLITTSLLRDISYISTDAMLQDLLESNLFKQIQGPSYAVGVYFQFDKEKCVEPGQFDDGELVAISIAGADLAVVLELGSLSQEWVLNALNNLFSDALIVKVLYDVHRAAFVLHRNRFIDVDLANCVDLQLLYENAINPLNLQASMLTIVNHCKTADSSSIKQTTSSFKAKVRPANPDEWACTPLPEPLLQMLVNEAKMYVLCYDEFDKSLVSIQDIKAITSARWINAVKNRGHQAIWFDPEADNQPRSLECQTGGLYSQGEILHLELQCELDPLLDLLPANYRDAILAIDDYQNKLVDVCLDVGRIPFVYTGKKKRVVLSKNGETVSKDTIDEIIFNLGGEMRIGNDNRAGIDRQLHRISVMRSKTDEVYGLTMRVGRALRNAACVLTDLLLSEKHADKSVLVLGHPGSGKTTLIRDVARCVSETMENVCIIDTSNEIGGDGLVPHACVGWARRMMVPSLEVQAGVMVECVQNHTVETLIVDEIGRKAEVLAASTVRQRGPRLIASAHGDFRALIKNPDLKGLVGGSQQVIVGDSAAAKTASKTKLQTQRAGNPIFDVIVELDHVVRGRCRIIWDVAKAVDSVLEGNGYSFETRQWDATTHGVQLIR